MLAGGWLALLSSTPAQAQIHNSSVLLAGQGVIETLPPPQNLQPIPYSQQPLPQLQPAQPVQVNQYEQDFQPGQPVEINQYNQNQPAQPAQVKQYNQNFQRYLVYVDSNNYQTLQQIRLIEPGAYIRQYKGRSVIQSGIFNQQSNAQQRLRQLESRGINGARVVNFVDGQEITTSSNRGNSKVKGSNYYVAIPASSKDLPSIADKIRQNIGRYDIVLERKQPRGPHVAVGPFTQRTDAEEWNNYLRKLGFGNARVYYGK
jgi:hypothetical protein